MKKSELRKIILEEIKKYLIGENIYGKLQEWAKNIANNYNKDIDTDILSQLHDAAKDLGLDIKAIDKEWQRFHPGSKVIPEDIARILKAGASKIKEQLFAMTDKGFKELEGKDIQIVVGGSYHLGASSSPNHIIVTKVTPEKFWYRSYPYKEDYVISTPIGKHLINSGMKNWLKSGYSKYHPERAAAYKRALAGGKPYIQKLEDYQYWVVEIQGAKGVDVYGIAKNYGVVKDWNEEKNTATAEVMKQDIPDIEKEKGIKIISKRKK